MKTITKTFNVYTIDELKNINKKSYNKAIEEAEKNIIDSRFMFAEDDAIELLKNDYNIDTDGVYYSVTSSQGDGFCFVKNNLLSYTALTKNENLNIFEKWINDNLSKEEKELLIEYLNCGYNLKIIKENHRYAHPHTCRIDYEYFYSSDDEAHIDRINNFIATLCSKLFNNVFLDICGQLEKYLYSFYDVSNEEAEEYLTVNEYCFLEDGSIY